MADLGQLKCPICGHLVDTNNTIKRHEAHQHCRYCRSWNISLQLVAIAATLAVIILLAFHIVKYGFIPRVFVNVSGLVSDVWGGFFIATGFIERILGAMQTFGGFGDIEKYLPI